MKRLILTVAMLTASLLFAFGAADNLPQRLRGHIEYLTSEELAGRKAGTPEGYLAGDYVREHFSRLGLLTFERADYYHPFATTWEDGVFRNVVGRIEGSESGKYIVIGAHYDHLGVKKGEIYHGADDNASGTAALLEVARLLVESGHTPRHTLILAAFDAEELGMHGSKDLAERLPRGSVKVMINMDMVGWLKDGELRVEGTATLNGAEELIGHIAEKHNLTVALQEFERGIATATDTEPFAQRGCPTLTLNTGSDSPYHKPQDTSDKIDYEGVAAVVEMVTELVTAIDGSESINPSGRIARKHSAGSDGIDVGLSLGFGSNYALYPSSAVVGKEAGAWQLGLSLQYARGHFGVRSGVLYDHRKTLVPTDLGSAASEAAKLITHRLTIPLELMATTNLSIFSYYLGAGGYYSHTFGTRGGSLGATVNPNEWGLQWSVGMRVADIYFEATRRYGLTPLYPSADKMVSRSALCTLGLFF